MEIDFNEVMQRMSDQEVFEIAQAAKTELKGRLEKRSVYEPTGDTERDTEHYQDIQWLRDLLAQL